MSDIHKFMYDDHQRIERLFTRLQRSASDYDLIMRLCDEIEIHSQTEDEIVYPALAQVSSRQVGKAEDDHAAVSDLIAEIRDTEPNDPQLSRLVKRLQRTLGEHIRFEEAEIFPSLKKLPDALELGMAAYAFRQEVVAQMTGRAPLKVTAGGWPNDFGKPYLANTGWS